MVRYNRGLFNTTTMEEEVRTQSGHPQRFSNNACLEEDYQNDFWGIFEEEL
jgi:hypothetical protein